MPDSTVPELISRLRVRTGSLIAVAVLLLATPTWPSVLVGIFLSALGLVVRTWASGHLRKEKKLAVSGPYRYSRNPLYLGNFILGIGIAAGAYSWWVLAIAGLYFALFYPILILEEKKRMKELFPQEYEEYGKKVPLFFPSFRKRNDSSPEKFSWLLYKQNKEYRALLGTAAFWLLLITKLLVLNR